MCPPITEPGMTGIFDYGPVADLNGPVTPTFLPGINTSVTLTATERQYSQWL